MAINIKENGNVSVYSPRFVGEREIHQFIREKAQWIVRNVQEATEDYNTLKAKKYSHGHDFMFLGKKYRLAVIEKNIRRAQIHFDGERWLVKVPAMMTSEQRQEIVKEKLMQWFRSQALEILGCRVFHYSRIMEIEPIEIVIRAQKHIWGSCHHDKNKINLNWQLVMAPQEVLDYVIVHELCHLFHPNHSKRYWRKVGSILPDYKKRQKWLRDHALEVRLPK